MARTLVSNIGLLVTNDSTQDGTPLGIIREAALVIDNGLISWVGLNSQTTKSDFENSVDANGNCIIPGFVDSHSHIIFAGDRSDEFRARMNGESYSAGGIKSTVAQTRAASNQELLSNGRRLFSEANTTGTTTMEIKSGYGLTVKDEARSLEIASSLTDETTFLGAHVIPVEFQNDPDGYVDLVCGEMLEAVKPHSKWIDVFCEKGAFTSDQTRKVLKAGIAKGLMPRLHANQLEAGDGIKIGVELDAASVDHVSHISDNDI
ncbi:MAG: imidazolonepropionase, partial [Acidobacteria bacterium]|nr:imidazolonepropionase [Acidobacteriota bacterium]